MTDAPPANVVPVAEGWDSDVFIVDRTWVVRVPRRPKVARRGAIEIRLLRELEAALPVAVPRLEEISWDGRAAVRSRFLAGKPLGGGSAAVAVDVAAFLTALHGFPIGGAVDDTFAARAAFYHRVGPWYEVTYGLDVGPPSYVESGLAGVRARLPRA